MLNTWGYLWCLEDVKGDFFFVHRKGVEED